MKAIVLSALCLGSAWAQAVPSAAQPKPQAPPAKLVALPALPDDAKIAEFPDGMVMTMGELRNMVSDMDPQNQQAALSGLQQYLDKYAVARTLAQMAVQDKLDQHSPDKERLMLARMQILAQAEVQKMTNPPMIDASELENYYNINKAKYQQVKVDAIYIAFTSSPSTSADGKKTLSEAEAKAKITGLLKQIQEGADFKKMAKQYSDDETSRAKDGFFATIGAADNIPDAIRSAIFQLKTGEVTGVIPQAAGFYIFRADEVTFKPFAEVRDQVYGDVKMQYFTSAFDKIRSTNKAKILAPELLGAPAGK